MNCEEFNRIIFEEDPEQNAELKAHTAVCPSCSERMKIRIELSRISRQKHETWDSPFLWPKIRNNLRTEPAGNQSKWRMFSSKAIASFTRRWGLYTAIALLALVSLSALWLFDRQNGHVEIREHLSDNVRNRLLTEQALSEIERTEAEYIESINRLSELVEPGIAQSTSSLMINYREKLMLLDAAIMECRESIETNRYNAHLRNELLSVYQEKHKTLQELSREH